MKKTIGKKKRGEQDGPGRRVPCRTVGAAFSDRPDSVRTHVFCKSGPSVCAIMRCAPYECAAGMRVLLHAKGQDGLSRSKCAPGLWAIASGGRAAFVACASGKSETLGSNIYRRTALTPVLRSLLPARLLAHVLVAGHEGLLRRHDRWLLGQRQDDGRKCCRGINVCFPLYILGDHALQVHNCRQ